VTTAPIRTVLAALDSAQGRADRRRDFAAATEAHVAELEAANIELAAAVEQVHADRDRLAARVAELETERDATARLTYERWHSIAASIRNLSAHANGFEREAKNATISDARESGDETEAEATAEPMPLDEAFETLRELPGFADWREGSRP
jgi:hypothetical protein